MAMPIFNLYGSFNITIRMPEVNGETIHHTASNNLILFERLHAPAEERYHLRWFDIVSHREENFFVKSYSDSANGRRYTIINEFEFSFLFERVARRCDT